MVRIAHLPRWLTLIGSGCLVGHAAHLEGTAMSAGCLIGSMSTCLSFVAIGFGSLVGSGTLVTPLTHAPGQSRLPDSPAQIAPHSDPKGFAAELAYGVATYVANARECARTQRCLD